MGYGLDGRGLVFRFPEGTRALTFLHRVQTGSGAHPIFVRIAQILLPVLLLTFFLSVLPCTTTLTFVLSLPLRNYCGRNSKAQNAVSVNKKLKNG